MCKITNFTQNSINCVVPKIINPQILDKYNTKDQEATFSKCYDVYADNAWPKQFINDEKLTTAYSSTNSFCYITFDFRQDYLFEAQEIHYYPFTGTAISAFYGLMFQGSFDGTSWDNLFTLDKNIKTGWNIWSGSASPSYRFFRIQSPIDKHPSQCGIAEVKFYGIKYYGKANTLEMACDAVLKINGYNQLLPSQVIYNQNSTPVVTDVSPNIGPTSGGSILSILGSGFGYRVSDIDVFVDDIRCTVRIVTNEKIVCVTGAK